MKDEKDLVNSLLAHDEDVPVPADHEKRIREGLGALLAAGAAPSARVEPRPSAARSAQSALRKWMSTAAVAAAFGGGGFVAGRATAPKESVPPAISVLPSSTRVEPLPSATVVPASASSAAPSAPVTVEPRPTASPSGQGVTQGGGQDAFDREQSLLERARSALVRHDADAARAALDECDRLFPRSRHAEERDYLRLQVLRESGNVAALREKAKAFLAKYPDSMLRGRVEPLAQ